LLAIIILLPWNFNFPFEQWDGVILTCTWWCSKPCLDVCHGLRQMERNTLGRKKKPKLQHTNKTVVTTKVRLHNLPCLIAFVARPPLHGGPLKTSRLTDRVPALSTF
jgi:hypothetical protein